MRWMLSGVNSNEVLATGGLGNQLFALSFAIELAHRTGVESVVNTHRCSSAPSALERVASVRDFALGQGVTLSSEPPPRHTRIRSRLDPSWVRERTFGYDPHLVRPARRATYEGFFQTWKHFTSTGAVIRQRLLGIVREVSWDFCQSAGLNSDFKLAHIRRGDYLGATSFHGLCSLGYFRRGLSLLHSDAPNVVVTNAVDEELRELRALGDIDTVLPAKDLDDPWIILGVMARASGVVMSNSSLSWWGAWLGQRNSRQVVAPRPWFQASNMDTTDLLVPEWLTLGRDLK